MMRIFECLFTGAAATAIAMWFYVWLEVAMYNRAVEKRRREQEYARKKWTKVQPMGGGRRDEID